MIDSNSPVRFKLASWSIFDGPWNMLDNAIKQFLRSIMQLNNRSLSLRSTTNGAIW